MSMDEIKATIDASALTGIPALTLGRLVESQQKALKFFAICTATIDLHASLFKFFEDNDYSIRVDADLTLISVALTGDGPTLARVWSHFRRHGYICTERPKKDDTQFYGWWRQKECADILLSFTSTLCKRVQVGTKMVEQPVYETQCGELTGLEDLITDAPVAAE
jgi:hypothetical protein